jgi:hypothetical protein
LFTSSIHPSRLVSLRIGEGDFCACSMIRSAIFSAVAACMSDSRKVS